MDKQTSEGSCKGGTAMESSLLGRWLPEIAAGMFLVQAIFGVLVIIEGYALSGKLLFGLAALGIVYAAFVRYSVGSPGEQNTETDT